MANSKFEYVKSFEVEDEIFLPNLIVVTIDGRDFARFSMVHEFEKPNDERGLHLMNACAVAVLEAFPDIVFSYGHEDEFSFVFKKSSKFYQRRASKILSLIVSYFTSAYVTNWSQFFPQKELIYPPSFHSRVISCATINVLQAYLAWRQYNCHINNQYNTCVWMLVKHGKSERDAQELLKGTQKQEKNELLFQEFGINYRRLPEIFRQGSCIFKIEMEDIVKYKENGTPIKRLRRKAKIVHAENIAAKSFWNEHDYVVKEVGGFEKDINKIKKDYLRSFLFENKLMPSTWIVIRIDGCHFHRFSEVHAFEKPIDEQALNLMNSCAVAVLEEFPDVTFAYGVSDEYSFVLKRKSNFYKREACEIVSVITSFFTSTYVLKWNEFFPHKALKYPPSFDGRAVCYPSSDILKDYLSWRQVDCHINNQYNTCFWMLVKSGKSKSDAQRYLKGTQTKEKNDLLLKEFNINYGKLPVIFRQGSSVFRVKAEKTNGFTSSSTATESVVIVSHCNIIDRSFWQANPRVLDEESDMS